MNIEEYNLKQYELDQTIKKAQVRKQELTREYLDFHSKYEVGDTLTVKTRSGKPLQVKVKAVSICSFNPSTIALNLVRPNKDGSTPKIGKVFCHFICQDDAAIINK